MSIFSFARFPALYLSSLIANSFGLALCVEVQNKDTMIKGTIAWFSISIILNLVLATMDYMSIQDKGLDFEPNIFTIISILIGFINYVVIFTLYFNNTYALKDSPKKTISSIMAVTGVFFTMFVLSLIYEIFMYAKN